MIMPRVTKQFGTVKEKARRANDGKAG